MNTYTKTVRSVFSAHADNKAAGPMSAYMKDLFPFFGIKKPLRSEISKPLLAKSALPSYQEAEECIREFWEMPERELQYFALDLILKYRGNWTPASYDLCEFMIQHRSWWDTVDMIAAKIVGPIVLSDPSERRRMNRWNNSDHLWLQRAAILHQIKYKKDTDRRLLSTYVLTHSKSKEFFLRKAIGWSLREYAKTEPDWVREFVQQHERELSPLSVREALKNL